MKFKYTKKRCNSSSDLRRTSTTRKQRPSVIERRLAARYGISNSHARLIAEMQGFASEEI